MIAGKEGFQRLVRGRPFLFYSGWRIQLKRTRYYQYSSRCLCTRSGSSHNYFAKLGLPEEFNVDSERLATRYKQLQLEWHPDKYAMRSESERQSAAAMSADLNAAFDVLKTPHQRAHHLLRLRGVVPTSVDGPLPHSDLSPKFLAWIMDFRERLDAATDNPQQLSQLRKEFKPQLDACLSSLELAFRENRLKDATKDATKLQYFTSIQCALEDVLPG